MQDEMLKPETSKWCWCVLVRQAFFVLCSLVKVSGLVNWQTKQSDNGVGDFFPVICHFIVFQNLHST